MLGVRYMPLPKALEGVYTEEDWQQIPAWKRTKLRQKNDPNYIKGKRSMPEFLQKFYTEEEFQILSWHIRNKLIENKGPVKNKLRSPIPEGYTEEKFRALPDHQKYALRNPDAYKQGKIKNKEWSDRVSYGKIRYERDKYDKDWKAWDLKKWAEGLKRDYNITPEEYQKLFDLQKGLCGICHNLETRIIKRQTTRDGPSIEVVSRLCVDHEHDTGIVRGLLCHECNKKLKSQNGTALIWLKTAITYLGGE